TSKTLLDNYNIVKPLVSYHKFNEIASGNKIIEDLKNGKNIAVISDAGMPGISDPGNIIVNLCKNEGLPYTVISGATALINAFVLSGYETPFTFVGFLPDNNTKKTKLLEELSKISSTLIFYCSPHSLNENILDLFNFLGDREVCFVREISKKFEEISYSTLSKGFNSTLKGEFVVLVRKGNKEISKDGIDEKLKTLLDMGLSKTEASKVLAKLTGQKKGDIYKNLNNMK
ncbi:MAG: 16S rRNA (cytidine(1402)-2'-O)-methyltransferase, partial [Christensenellales bacterium]